MPLLSMRGLVVAVAIALVSYVGFIRETPLSPGLSLILVLFGWKTYLEFFRIYYWVILQMNCVGHRPSLPEHLRE